MFTDIIDMVSVLLAMIQINEFLSSGSDGQKYWSLVRRLQVFLLNCITVSAVCKQNTNSEYVS